MHTKGPWKIYVLDVPLEDTGKYIQECVDNSPEKKFFFISAAHPDGGLADVCHVGNGPTSEANARLIAAAPDLLEACKQAKVAMAGTDWPVRKAVEAAIAKAETGE